MIPASSRIPVPAFIKLSGCFASRRSPPSMVSVLASCRVIPAPSAFIALSVASVSPAASQLRISDVPRAIDASMTARCEIDLSPGTVTAPRKRRPAANETPMPIVGFHNSAPIPPVPVLSVPANR